MLEDDDKPSAFICILIRQLGDVDDAFTTSLFKMSSAKERVVLYTYFRSSCSGRLRIALNLKGIDYEPIFINLLKAEHASKEYDLINPSHFVPSLRLEGEDGRSTIVVQSVAMLEYLEEKYPDSLPLLPPSSDVLGRAQVRALVNVIACDTQPVTNMRIFKSIDALGGSREAWAKEYMSDGFEAYEKLAAKTAGKFSYGDNVTLADVCLIPAIWGGQRFGVDLDRFPTVKRVFEAMSQLDAVKRAQWNSQEDCPEDLKAR